MRDNERMSRAGSKKTVRPISIKIQLIWEIDVDDEMSLIYDFRIGYSNCLSFS